MSQAIAAAFLDAVGASVGPLYATGLEPAGAAVKDRLNLDAHALKIQLAALIDGIAERGKAHIGDQTMLDAWNPEMTAIGDAAMRSMSTVYLLATAAQAAQSGTEATGS